ncbi:hypothetical protein ACHAW6_008525 [Cyclotella cf. meneghiniana]
MLQSYTQWTNHPLREERPNHLLMKTPEKSHANRSYQTIYECSITKNLIITQLWIILFYLHGAKPMIRATSKGGTA